jgi:hypothetical protein
MAAKRPARASLRYAKAPLSPRDQRELHRLLALLVFEPSGRDAALRVGDGKALECDSYLRRISQLTYPELCDHTHL